MKYCYWVFGRFRSPPPRPLPAVGYAAPNPFGQPRFSVPQCLPHESAPLPPRPPAKAATIKDIARELGISITTVSRAMRGFPDVNPETRQAVLRQAASSTTNLTRWPSAWSRSTPHSIGVIVPNLDYFFATAVRGIDELAIEAGYTVLTCQSNESYGREITNTQRLMNSRVDGLIVSLSSATSNVDHFRRLLQRGCPWCFSTAWAPTWRPPK